MPLADFACRLLHRARRVLYITPFRLNIHVLHLLLVPSRLRTIRRLLFSGIRRSGAKEELVDMRGAHRWREQGSTSIFPELCCISETLFRVISKRRKDDLIEFAR